MGQCTEGQYPVEPEDQPQPNDQTVSDNHNVFESQTESGIDHVKDGKETKWLVEYGNTVRSSTELIRSDISLNCADGNRDWA